ncbi:MAG: Gfo/Idh/MocA family protein [Flavobacteriales bacterium]
MNVKFAVVGCGSIGKRHAAVLDADPKASLVALCDVNQEARESLSAAYGGVPSFADFTEMLESTDADVVNIVTPHDLHAPMAVEALSRGFHVLVEKPMALSSADAARMNDAAARAGRKLWVVKQNRFNVPVRIADEAIRTGALGRLFMVKCDILWNRHQGYYDDSPWRGRISREGGALFTQASHFIDLLTWWAGDVVSAKAIADTQNHHIETEDSGVAAVKFDSGALGSIVWTTCVHRKNLEGSVTLIGENGTIRIGGEYLNKLEFWDVPGMPLPDHLEFTDKPNSYGKYQGTSSNHEKVIAGVIADMEGNSATSVEGAEGIRSIRAIETIYASIRE